MSFVIQRQTNLREQSVPEFLSILKAVSPECSGVHPVAARESGVCRGQSFAWMGFDALSS